MPAAGVATAWLGALYAVRERLGSSRDLAGDLGLRESGGSALRTGSPPPVCSTGVPTPVDSAPWCRS
ncbi:hypothetical protein [Streptomyces monashensis]|uniref:hypothetical protein n=1 Tax=Streptomyces monashensis TaxID=1678012 RepID=UPI001160C572|nr:hypothetical protein [Streptomyces monashensis]